MPVSDKRSWDVGKFLETLNYFGEIPFIGSFRWLQKLAGQTTTYEGLDMSKAKKKVAILSSRNKASALDKLFQSEAWQNHLQKQIQAQLKEPTRFDFYDVNRRGLQDDLTSLLKSSVRIIILGTSTLSILLNADEDVLGESSDFVEQQVFDFTKSSEILASWGTLDDVVMGGVSQSGMSLSAQEYAVFSGNVSTENSGGFASVRTKNFEPPFNFLGWEGMRLRIKGDGGRYKFILRNSSGWDSPAYIYSFDTKAGEWLSVNVPFAEMVSTFRAKSMPNAAAFDPAQVYSFQLMLSKFEYDRQLNPQFEPGPFSLQIRSINVYRQQQEMALIAVTESADVWWQTKLAELGVTYHWLKIEASDAATLTTDLLAEKLAPLLS